MKKKKKQQGEREIGPEFVNDLRVFLWALLRLTGLLKAPLHDDLSVEPLATRL